MNILFILYHGMTCNSALHVSALARELHALGDRCRIAVPDSLLPAHGRVGSPAPDLFADAPDLEPVGFRQLLRQPQRPETLPDVLVAWTPRENVRRLVVRLRQRWHRPVVVHLEDNEDTITAGYLGLSIDALQRRTRWPVRALRGLALAHPHRMRTFLAQASGVSLLMDRLGEFVPNGVPSCVFWPGYDETLFGASAPLPLGASSGPGTANIPPDATVLTYTGNIHRGNRHDMAELYGCVARLNATGRSTRLLRTGETHDLDFPAQVADAAPYVIELGHVAREHLPGLMQRADVLVQPGGPGLFNDYRFPSKLPEYLASGRPVVLARTNLGRFLTSGQEALVVPRGTVEELAHAVCRVVSDPALAARLGGGGRAFAERSLRWPKAAATFRELLKAASQPANTPR